MSVVRPIAVAWMAALLAIAALTFSPGNQPTVPADGDTASVLDDPDLPPPCAISTEAAVPAAVASFPDGPVLQPRTSPAEVFRPPQTAV